MSKCKKFLAAMTVVLSFSSMARGTLTSFAADAPYIFTPTGAIIMLEVPSFTPSSVTVSATADAPFLVMLVASNNTALSWMACTLVSDLAGVAEFVPGSGQSTDFQNITDIDKWTMRFEAPSEVPPGEFVTLEFGLKIPDTGSVTFTQTLTPVPVPEPATVALLGLGALALVTTRKHA